MSYFDFLSLLGGLTLFLYGMCLMGEGLRDLGSRRARELLGRSNLTKGRAFFAGAAVTALIQSSSVVTVMTVGLVNAGFMNLERAAAVIMGSNVGTTLSGWLITMGSQKNIVFWRRMLQPLSFSPMIGVCGLILHGMSRGGKRRQAGDALLGFSFLIFGMNAMSAAAGPLAGSPVAMRLAVRFERPVEGILAGAVLTAVLQSSSAAIGILQTAASVMPVRYAMVIPLILGQNIGTCVTALLSGVGTSLEAKRAALVHFYFNLVGVLLLGGTFYILHRIHPFPFMNQAVNEKGIALIHTVFNLASAAVLLPFSDLLTGMARMTAGKGKQ